ncbi:MAG TPA: hypothetical protein VER58_20790 [Thermoanaerobaculia bacterium]|nr:hypothetical protein [Thermoanaerobaculia bacterium]
MEPTVKIERIIWAALFASILIYCLIAFTIAQRNAQRPFQAALHDEFTIILYSISALTFVAAFFTRARFRERGAPRRLYNIIAWALLESITIYGFILALVRMDWKMILPPAALTIAGFIITFPHQA